MNSPLRLTAALPGEGRIVARAIARSLPPDLLPLTIWRSPRAGLYVEWLLHSRDHPDAPRYYLLRRGGRLAGLAAFRTVDHAAFLEHLWVTPGLRGRGLGRRLLAAASWRYLRWRPSLFFALDVFAGLGPGSWYRRLGLSPVSERHWSVRTAADAAGSVPARLPLHDLDAAERAHREWGFSRFTAGPYPIGRLYAPYFRLTDPQAARDPALLRLLARLDPQRRLLLIAPGPPPRCWRTVARHQRLAGSADAFFERLRTSHA